MHPPFSLLLTPVTTPSSHPLVLCQCERGWGEEGGGGWGDRRGGKMVATIRLPCHWTRVGKRPSTHSEPPGFCLLPFAFRLLPFVESIIMMVSVIKAEWQNGRMEKWKNGRVEEWKNGRMEEWQNGRMEEWKNGRMGDWKMEEWQNGRMWLTRIFKKVVASIF